MCVEEEEGCAPPAPADFSTGTCVSQVNLRVGRERFRVWLLLV